MGNRKTQLASFADLTDQRDVEDLRQLLAENILKRADSMLQEQLIKLLAGGLQQSYLENLPGLREPVREREKRTREGGRRSRAEDAEHTNARPAHGRPTKREELHA